MVQQQRSVRRGDEATEANGHATCSSRRGSRRSRLTRRPRRPLDCTRCCRRRRPRLPVLQIMIIMKNSCCSCSSSSQVHGIILLTRATTTAAVAPRETTTGRQMTRRKLLLQPLDACLSRRLTLMMTRVTGSTAAVQLQIPTAYPPHCHSISCTDCHLHCRRRYCLNFRPSGSLRASVL